MAAGVIAADPCMAQLLGLKVTRIYLITVIFSFAMAGIAGGLLMPNQSLSPELGGIFLLALAVNLLVKPEGIMTKEQTA